MRTLSLRHRSSNPAIPGSSLAGATLLTRGRTGSLVVDRGLAASSLTVDSSLKVAKLGGFSAALEMMEPGTPMISEEEARAF
ncbi:hypothetical protein F2Q69_00012698 [Brassica cretica]|uniref:Uncharacterized protein n=1 Tax=Brassica cretica TaxID=69181 RepID=A0A8S9R8A9_BRACR|nr:hypothetical protein F2Q69_00012698 [Brassica cretica]